MPCSYFAAPLAGGFSKLMLPAEVVCLDMLILRFLWCRLGLSYDYDIAICSLLVHNMACCDRMFDKSGKWSEQCI